MSGNSAQSRVLYGYGESPSKSLKKGVASSKDARKGKFELPSFPGKKDHGIQHSSPQAKLRQQQGGQPSASPLKQGQSAERRGSGDASQKRVAGLEHLKALSSKARPVQLQPLLESNGQAIRGESTLGFESPENAQVVKEITKSEMRDYVKQHAARRDTHKERRRRKTDDVEQDAPDQSPSKLTAPVHFASHPRKHKYELATEAAACLIQRRWRSWLAWKAELRKEAEERTLRELLADGFDEQLLLGIAPQLLEAKLKHSDVRPFNSSSSSDRYLPSDTTKQGGYQQQPDSPSQPNHATATTNVATASTAIAAAYSGVHNVSVDASAATLPACTEAAAGSVAARGRQRPADAVRRDTNGPSITKAERQAQDSTIVSKAQPGLRKSPILGKQVHRLQPERSIPCGHDVYSVAATASPTLADQAHTRAFGKQAASRAAEVETVHSKTAVDTDIAGTASNQQQQATTSDDTFKQADHVWKGQRHTIKGSGPVEQDATKGAVSVMHSQKRRVSRSLWPDSEGSTDDDDSDIPSHVVASDAALHHMQQSQDHERAISQTTKPGSKRVDDQQPANSNNGVISLQAAGHTHVSSQAVNATGSKAGDTQAKLRVAGSAKENHRYQPSDQDDVSSLQQNITLSEAESADDSDSVCSKALPQHPQETAMQISITHPMGGELHQQHERSRSEMLLDAHDPKGNTQHLGFPVHVQARHATSLQSPQPAETVTTIADSGPDSRTRSDCVQVQMPSSIHVLHSASSKSTGGDMTDHHAQIAQHAQAVFAQQTRVATRHRQNQTTATASDSAAMQHLLTSGMSAPPVAAPQGASTVHTTTASLTTEKMTSILSFLDTVEQQAEEEAVALQLAAEPSSSSHASQHRPRTASSSHPATAASRPSTAAAAPISHPATTSTSSSKHLIAPPEEMLQENTANHPRRPRSAYPGHTTHNQSPFPSHTGSPANQHAHAQQDVYTQPHGHAQPIQRGQPPMSHVDTAGQAVAMPHFTGASDLNNSHPRPEASPNRHPTAHVPNLAQHYQDSYAQAQQFTLRQSQQIRDWQDDNVSVAGFSEAGSQASGSQRLAFRAESVYEGVRAKMRRLQEDVKERDVAIAAWQKEVETLQQQQRALLTEADERLSDMLATQRQEYEAAIARHLAFVDRLLADKDELTHRCTQLTEQLQGMDARQERAIAKLKEGWAAEMRRQRQAAESAEKIKREQWMEQKSGEIKELTVKGLEAEVQKLLAKHKAELAAVQQSAAEDARRQLDAYIAQNELALRQIKEKMLREQEEAIEKERASAGARLREAHERSEQQLQLQRARLVADADMKLEQLEAARKEDRKRHEDAMARASAEAEERERQLRDDFAKEKELLRKTLEKQMDALREQYETGQEGWRAAIAERARKELADREAAIKDRLTRERNEEIEAIMQRLEAEHALARSQLQEEYKRREDAHAAKHNAALKEVQKSEAKYADRFRAASLAQQAAEERQHLAEVSAQELRREIDSKNSTIRWLEAQVTAAKEEAAQRERDLRSVTSQKDSLHEEAVAAVQRDRDALAQRLVTMQQEVEELKRRHSTEMNHVEARVRAALSRKDETISGLREQLAGITQQLRATEAVLAQQQEELGYE